MKFLSSVKFVLTKFRLTYHASLIFDTLTAQKSMASTIPRKCSIAVLLSGICKSGRSSLEHPSAHIERVNVNIYREGKNSLQDKLKLII